MNKALPLTLTLQDALGVCGLGRTKFYELIKNGKIQSIRVGKRRLIVYASLKTFLEQGDEK
jgi:excisionase family DNA binding protein